jgi:hypothetical protein
MSAARFCEQCGAELGGDARFCSECGAPAAPAAAAPTRAAAPSPLRYCGPGGDCGCPHFAGAGQICAVCGHRPERHRNALPPPPQPPYAPIYPPVVPGPYVVPQRTNGFAIAALVLGIVWVYWIGSILALIFGYIAKGQIDRSGGAEGGRGMAIAGIVLGWIGVGILLLALVLGASLN